MPEIIINAIYYSFNYFCFQANFEQICMHALMTFSEKLVLMRSVVLDL